MPCSQHVFLGRIVYGGSSGLWPADRPDLRETAMAMDAGEIERLIKMRIPDAEVTIRDLAGDGDH